MGWRGLATRALCPDRMTQSLQAPETGGSQEERGEETLQRRGNKRNVLFSAHGRSGSFLFHCSRVILLRFPGEFNPVSSFCACTHTQTHIYTDTHRPPHTQTHTDTHSQTNTDTQKEKHRPSDTDTDDTQMQTHTHTLIYTDLPNTHTYTLTCTDLPSTHTHETPTVVSAPALRMADSVSAAASGAAALRPSE